MAPNDGGPWVWKKEYAKAAQEFLAQFELPEMDVFAREISNDPLNLKWFEIVCNNQVSRNFDTLLSAVDAFRVACAPFADLRVSGLRMKGKAEWDGGMISNDASYRARVAFEGTQNVDRWAADHKKLENKASLLLEAGIEEVVFAPRRIGSEKQKLITRPQFVAM